MKILVLGMGYTGTVIARHLANAGHEVWGMNRTGRNAPPGVTGLAGDVRMAGGLENLATLPPLDLMVSALSGTGHRGPAYREVVVNGPPRVVERVRWNGQRQVLFLGSTGVYGDAGGGWVDESTPALPRHPAGEAQLLAEAALGQCTDALCALRLSGLYGPGRIRLIRQALRRRPYLKPDLWSNQIHRDDVAGIVRFLVGRPPPFPGCCLPVTTAPPSVARSSSGFAFRCARRKGCTRRTTRSAPRGTGGTSGSATRP